MFALEETRHATAATAVVKSSSFTKEEVLTTQSTANHSLSRKKTILNLAESILLDKYGSWHSRDRPTAVCDGRAQQSNLETRTYITSSPPSDNYNNYLLNYNLPKDNLVLSVHTIAG